MIFLFRRKRFEVSVSDLGLYIFIVAVLFTWAMMADNPFDPGPIDPSVTVEGSPTPAANRDQHWLMKPGTADHYLSANGKVTPIEKSVAASAPKIVE